MTPCFKYSDMRHVSQVSLQHRRGGINRLVGKGVGWRLPFVSMAPPVWRFPGSSFQHSVVTILVNEN